MIPEIQNWPQAAVAIVFIICLTGVIISATGPRDKDGK